MTHGLKKSLLTLVCVLAGCSLLPSAAGAVVVGIGSQTDAFMADPLFKALNIHEARLVVPWNVAVSNSKEVRTQLEQAKQWLNEAFALGITPVVSFGRDNGNAGIKAPPVKQYTKAIKAFIKAFPKVRSYTAWNEPDWVYITLGRDARLGASYFNALVHNCHHCTALAGDLYLAAKPLARYIKAYKKGLRVKPSGWALHNYNDVRAHNANQLKAMMRLTSGPIWLTEISGVERRGHWQYKNQSGAAAGRDEKYLFSMAKKFHRISRIYHYQWQGTTKAVAGWDSGLLNPDGTIRAAYNIVEQAAL